MLEFNISAVFRNKIDDGIFNFDVVAVQPVNLISSLVGFCIVNTKSDDFYITLNKHVEISNEEVKELGERILNDAKKVEKVILS